MCEAESLVSRTLVGNLALVSVSVEMNDEEYGDFSKAVILLTLNDLLAANFSADVYSL